MSVHRSVAAVATAALLALAGCGTSSQSTPAPAASGASGASPTVATSASVEASGGSAAPSASPEETETPEPEPTPTPTPTATPEPTPTAEPEPTPEPIYQNIEDVEIGECFLAIRDADDDSTLAASIVACDQPHDSELFALELLEGGADAPYPGDEALDDPAVELCDAAFEAYVGVDYQESVYEYGYYTPSEGSWSAGDREVICVIEHGSETARSVRGSGE